MFLLINCQLHSLYVCIFQGGSCLGAIDAGTGGLHVSAQSQPDGGLCRQRLARRVQGLLGIPPLPQPGGLWHAHPAGRVLRALYSQ